MVGGLHPEVSQGKLGVNPREVVLTVHCMVQQYRLERAPRENFWTCGGGPEKMEFYRKDWRGVAPTKFYHSPGSTWVCDHPLSNPAGDSARNTRCSERAGLGPYQTGCAQAEEQPVTERSLDFQHGLPALHGGSIPHLQSVTGLDFLLCTPCYLFVGHILHVKGATSGSC